MKRIIAMVALFVVLLSGCSFLPGSMSMEGPMPVPTTEPVYNYETYFVVNCASHIIMYAAADINSEQMNQIPLGAGVSYIKTAENGFCKIAYQGQTGYALAANLSTEVPQIKETEYVTYYVVNCKSNITLRETPSTKAASLCKIPLGASVSYIGAAENGFYKITYMGKTGYALASYLSQDPNAHSQVKDTDTQSNKVYATCYVVNCKKSITLRSSPSTKASEYTQIPLGAAVSYVGTASNGFYKVIYNGKTGYALAAYLSFDEPYYEYD